MPSGFTEGAREESKTGRPEFSQLSELESSLRKVFAALAPAGVLDEGAGSKESEGAGAGGGPWESEKAMLSQDFLCAGRGARCWARGRLGRRRRSERTFLLFIADDIGSAGFRGSAWMMS